MRTVVAVPMSKGELLSLHGFLVERVDEPLQTIRGPYELLHRAIGLLDLGPIGRTATDEDGLGVAVVTKALGNVTLAQRTAFVACLARGNDGHAEE